MRGAGGRARVRRAGVKRFSVGEMYMRPIAEQPEPAGKTFEEHFAEINARLAAIRLNVMRYDAAAMQPAAKLPVAEAFRNLAEK